MVESCFHISEELDDLGRSAVRLKLKLDHVCCRHRPEIELSFFKSDRIGRGYLILSSASNSTHFNS